MKNNYLMIAFLLVCLLACGQSTKTEAGTSENQEIYQTKNELKESKMKIEIWSDVLCPFCYIGKRKFEMALAQFPNKENVQIIWKSYQLAPNEKTQPDKNSNEHLAEKMGISVEQAKAMRSQIIPHAQSVGLQYNMDNAVVANSFNAHRFTHFAKEYGKQSEAEEILFRSYFTDSKNIDDYPTLIQLGAEIGLDTALLKTALENGSYTNDVKADINEAQQIGVRGVPFFVFDRKQAISGAQDPKTFLETLEKSFAEWRKENPEMKLEVIEGKVCTPDKKCD